MAHVFITGDRHGSYKDIEQFCLKWNTSKDDLLIVLGDNGVNYYGPSKDRRIKNYLSSLPLSFFMIKGNHDMRPDTKLYSFSPKDIHPLVKGRCLYEQDYPSLLFAKMHGEYSFNIGNRWLKTFVLGGAYSADKYYRLTMQSYGHSEYKWFADEQMTDGEMQTAGINISIANPEVILSHTCPFKYIPRDMFISSVDQSTVDNTMEHWLDAVEQEVNYKKWYCGHWHTDRTVDKIRFMYYDIIRLSGE